MARKTTALNAQQNPSLCSLFTVPWSQTGLHLVGFVHGSFYLNVVDSCSKWPEVISLKSTITVTTPQRIFAKYYVPNVILSRNSIHFSFTPYDNPISPIFILQITPTVRKSDGLTTSSGNFPNYKDMGKQKRTLNVYVLSNWEQFFNNLYKVKTQVNTQK